MIYDGRLEPKLIESDEGKQLSLAMELHLEAKISHKPPVAMQKFKFNFLFLSPSPSFFLPTFSNSWFNQNYPKIIIITSILKRFVHETSHMFSNPSSSATMF
jgi:hypothetical protein